MNLVRGLLTGFAMAPCGFAAFVAVTTLGCGRSGLLTDEDTSGTDGTGDLDGGTDAGCTTNASCPTGERCDPGSRQCVPQTGDACAADTSTDPKNCGACGNVCVKGDSCAKGKCVVAAPCSTKNCQATCCDNECLDTTTDSQNCGLCGNNCPTGQSCADSHCVDNCNGATACSPDMNCCLQGCSDPATDVKNCGQCGVSCGPGVACIGGICQGACNAGPVCSTKQSCCADGCTSTQTDAAHCGTCDTQCAKGFTCVAGVCGCQGAAACGAGQACCPSGCTDTQTNDFNCGGCGIQCGATASCVGGTCAANEGAFDPNVNPTYLAPGVHRYTTINIPAGVTVYVGGAGAASGTLDLYATGDVTIDGTIDVSGGPGTQNTITSATTLSGRAGGGGMTGEPYASAPLSSACGFVGGNPGSLGNAVSGSAGNCRIASTTVCVGLMDPTAVLFTAPVAAYGGGGGVFTGFRAYGSGGGGAAGGAPGALGPAFMGEQDCSGVSGGGGAVNGLGGDGGGSPYDGAPGVLGSTQCAGVMGAGNGYIGGGGGGSIGAAAANDLAVATTFQTGSAGGGASADYLDRPVYGGTSGGAGGGGALRLTSPTMISVTGQLLAIGGAGGDAVIGTAGPACNPQPGAAGGGGSGGVIYLAAPTVSVAASAVVSAVGGAGGAQSEYATGGGGGAGGIGRIRISATQSSCTLAGSFTPSLASGCAPTGNGQRGFAYVGAFPN